MTGENVLRLLLYTLYYFLFWFPLFIKENKKDTCRICKCPV